MTEDTTIILKQWAINRAVKAHEGCAEPSPQRIVEMANEFYTFVAGPPAESDDLRLCLRSWVSTLRKTTLGVGAATQQRIEESLKKAGLL